MTKKKPNKDDTKQVPIDDSFIREVDEEIKQARLVNFFKDNALFLVGLSLLVVAIVGGRQIYVSYINERNTELANKYAEATKYYDLILGKTETVEIDIPALEKQLTDIDKSGYKTLLNYFLAHRYVKEGRLYDAYDAYKKTYTDKKSTRELRAVARVRAGFALLGVDHQKVNDAVYELANSDKSQFAIIAKEILATSALYTKDFGSAISLYQSILEDASTDQMTRQRVDNLHLLATLQFDIASMYPTVSHDDLKDTFSQDSELDDIKSDVTADADPVSTDSGVKDNQAEDEE